MQIKLINSETYRISQHSISQRQHLIEQEAILRTLRDYLYSLLSLCFALLCVPLLLSSSSIRRILKLISELVCAVCFTFWFLPFICLFLSLPTTLHCQCALIKTHCKKKCNLDATICSGMAHSHTFVSPSLAHSCMYSTCIFKSTLRELLLSYIYHTLWQ